MLACCCWCAVGSASTGIATASSAVVVCCCRVAGVRRFDQCTQRSGRFLSTPFGVDNRAASAIRNQMNALVSRLIKWMHADRSTTDYNDAAAAAQRRRVSLAHLHVVAPPHRSAAAKYVRAMRERRLPGARAASAARSQDRAERGGGQKGEAGSRRRRRRRRHVWPSMLRPSFCRSRGWAPPAGVRPPLRHWPCPFDNHEAIRGAFRSAAER